MSRIIATFLFCFVVIGLVACGGGSSTPAPTPTPPSSLVVSPSSASVAIGGSQTFSANTAGVTWSISGPGTINQNGVYLAPSTFPGSPNTATITATAGGLSGTATAAVVYPNNNQSFQSGAIKLGTEGGNVLDISSTECCVGTLGSLVNRGGNFFILSNNHVLALSDAATATGDAINQPGPAGCFASNKTVANVTQAVPIKPTAGTDPSGCTGSTAPFCGKSPDNVDAAIAAIIVGQVDTSGSILDLGPAGTTSISDAPPSATLFQGTPGPGQPVAKVGRTSSLTCSTIQGISGDFFVDYDASCGGPKAFSATFNNQLVVNGGNFIQPGDSGSLLVAADTARPMGLLFASGTSSAVANPIGTVLAQFASGGVTPTIQGGADHPVSCAPTQSIASTQVGAGSASTLTPQQRQAATSARDRHAGALRADPAVKSVSVGASTDSPGEGAVVIELSAAPTAHIPATLDGVRTRVIYAGTPPSLTNAQLESTIAIKQAHRDAVMSSRGIQGIAVGQSDDNPAEPAILIYTIKGVPHDPIPAVIDGVRTKVIESTRFTAK